MTTDHSSTTGYQAPRSDDAAASEHEAHMAALKLKASAAGQQIEVAARSTIDKVQAQLDEVAARLAHAEGDSRNELLARQAQLRAELDLAHMDLRSLGASAASAIADAALDSGNN